jgi:uncharacterized membrane protein YqjE
MPANERSISDVLQDIVRNVQEIIRSEVRLAKQEVREEANKATSAGKLIGAGAVTALYAGFFFLFMIFCALSAVMANWAAALIVSAILGIIAAWTLKAGITNFKLIHPAPERTMESLKENVEWVRQQTK